MKRSKNTFKAILTLMLAVFALALVGCEKDSQLISPEISNSVERQSAVTASGKTIHFLGFAEHELNSLNKKKKKEKHIEKDKGGNLKSSGKNNKEKIKFELTIPENAIDFSKTVGVEYDPDSFEGFADLVFSPHGTQFSPPALLDIKIKGVDLSGVSSNHVKLYYVNPNGQWDEIVCKSIDVKLDKGEIKIKEAELHHFSRYALAAD